MMLQFTTDTPTVATFPPIVQERMVTSTVLFLLAVVSWFSVLITVIRTRSVRSQLLGVMLVNLAVAMLIRAMVFAREMETESRGGLENFGAMGCHLYIFGQGISMCMTKATIIIICLDATFDLPQSRKTQVISTICVWVLAIAFTAVILYGLGNGAEINHQIDHHKVCFLIFVAPEWVCDLLDQLIFYYIPTTFVLVTFIKFGCTYRTAIATDGKKLPFLLTAVIYLTLNWVVELFKFSYIIRDKGLSSEFVRNFYWPYQARQFGMDVIPLIWVLFIPDLRSKFLCRKSVDNELTEINTGDIALTEHNESTQDVHGLVLQNTKGEHSLKQTDGGNPLLPHAALNWSQNNYQSPS